MISTASPFPDKCGWLEAFEREQKWHTCQTIHSFERQERIRGTYHLVSTILYHIPLIDAILYVITYYALSILNPFVMENALTMAIKEENKEALALLKERGIAPPPIEIEEEGPSEPPKPRPLPIYQRADIYYRMDRIFHQKRKNSPLLIGRTGVGKSTIAENFPEKEIIPLPLDPPPGWFEEVKKKENGVVLLDHLDDMPNEALKHLLANLKGVPLIGCCRKKGDHETLLEKEFTPLKVKSPNHDQCLEILSRIFSKGDKHHLWHAIIKGDQKSLPESAITLYDQWDKQGDFIAYVQKKQGVRTFTKEQILGVEKFLKERVIGQDYAIKEVANILRGHATQKGAPNALHFAGLTGTGKTELAETMAEWLYGSKKALLRIQMAEYVDAFKASTLLGAPVGYKGHNRGGIITERAKKGPFLLLLDDFHKGDPQVVPQILMGMCEKQKILDQKTHQTIDTKNVLVVLTSNFGSNEILEAMTPPTQGWLFGKSTPEKPPPLEAAKVKGLIRTSVSKKYTSEVLNRTHLIPFLPIEKQEERRKITKKILASEDRKMTYSKGFVNFLEKLWKPHVGAKEILRYVQGTLRGELVKFRLKTKAKKVHVDVKGGELLLEK